MKNLIIYIIVSLSCFLPFYSCDNTFDEKTYDNLTDADLLVNSPEFEAYEQALKTDRRMMRKTLKKLSTLQKIQYFEALSDLKEAKDISTFDSICQELTNILGIDFYKRIERIATTKNIFLLDENIPSTEILKAIQRKNASLSRSINSSEDEEEYDNCVYYCDRTYNVNRCGSGDWWNDIDYRVCIADMIDKRDSCIEDCGR